MYVARRMYAIHVSVSVWNEYYAFSTCFFWPWRHRLTALYCRLTSVDVVFFLSFYILLLLFFPHMKLMCGGGHQRAAILRNLLRIFLNFIEKKIPF